MASIMKSGVREHSVGKTYPIVVIGVQRPDSDEVTWVLSLNGDQLFWTNPVTPQAAYGPALIRMTAGCPATEHYRCEFYTAAGAEYIAQLAAETYRTTGKLPESLGVLPKSLEVRS